MRPNSAVELLVDIKPVDQVVFVYGFTGLSTLSECDELSSIQYRLTNRITMTGAVNAFLKVSSKTSFLLSYRSLSVKKDRRRMPGCAEANELDSVAHSGTINRPKIS